MTSKKRSVCNLLSGAIFVKSKHIKRFCEGFHTFVQIYTDFAQILRDFARILKDFARIFIKSNFLAVGFHHLHPYRLHHWP